MFARWFSGRTGGAGAVSPERVARAIVEAIRRERAEVNVWPVPARPLLVLDAISPALGDQLIRSIGNVPMNRDLAVHDAARRREHASWPD